MHSFSIIRVWRVIRSVLYISFYILTRHCIGIYNIIPPLQKIPRFPYDERVAVFPNVSERKHKREKRTVIVRSVCMQPQCTSLNIYYSSDLFSSFFESMFILMRYWQRCETLRFYSYGSQSLDLFKVSHKQIDIAQLSIPTHAQLQRHRLKFIKNHLKNSYMFRSSTIFRELQCPR